MAIAGRVAIVPKGDWSADATYKRLDAVTYNNTLYFAKKEVPAGTATSNTEYWSKSIVGGAGAIATTEEAGIVKPDGTTITVDEDGTLHGSSSVDEMTGATADKDGTSGTVPAPTAGQENRVLKGNGAWEAITYDSELSAESENAPKTKVVYAKTKKIEENLSQLSNPNLLINPDFRINQRGGKIALNGAKIYTDETCTTYLGLITETAVKATLLSNGNYSYISADGSTPLYVKAEDVVDGYCEHDKYSVDRWGLFDYDARMWVKPKGSGGITLCLGKKSGNVFIYKYNHIEKDNIDIDMACKTGLTCSVSINGNICSVYFSGEDIKEKKQTGFWSEPLYTNDNAEVRIQFIPQWGDVIGFIGIGMIGTPSNDVVIDVEWVKLELGSVATPFVPPDPASELVKCQRYFYSVFNKDSSPLAFVGDGRMNTSTTLFCSVNIPCTMRTCPTLNKNGNFVVNGDISINNIVIDNMNGNCALLKVTTSSSVPINSIATLQRSGNDAYMFFDAEIY